MRGTSGSVQRRPANPARPGREQRYRDHVVCRGVPEVPLIEFLDGEKKRAVLIVEGGEVEGEKRRPYGISGYREEVAAADF